MGYSFLIFSKDNEITQYDYERAFSKMGAFYKGSENFNNPVCDIKFEKGAIKVSGSFSLSGRYAEGFVLNLVVRLNELGYSTTVFSPDWEYGTDADKEWLKKHQEA